MAWTNPRTWSISEFVTKAILDTHIRDNQLHLGAARAAQVATSEGTASASYTDLTTTGPSVTVPVTATYVVAFGAFVAAQSDGGGGFISPGGSMSVGTYEAIVNNFGTLRPNISVMSVGVTSLTASDVVTLKYRGNGTGSTNFANRWVAIFPLTA